MLGALNTLDSTKTVAFLNEYREAGKGFRMTAKAPSSINATYLAVQALAGLGALPQQTKTEVTGYLKGTRYSGLIKESQEYAPPMIKPMAEMLESLTLVGGMDQINREKILEFVSSLYIGENGGFGPQPGYGTTPLSTHHAIVALVKLGKLPDPVAAQVTIMEQQR